MLLFFFDGEPLQEEAAPASIRPETVEIGYDPKIVATLDRNIRAGIEWKERRVRSRNGYRIESRKGWGGLEDPPSRRFEIVAYWLRVKQMVLGDDWYQALVRYDNGKYQDISVMWNGGQVSVYEAFPELALKRYAFRSKEDRDEFQINCRTN